MPKHQTYNISQYAQQGGRREKAVANPEDVDVSQNDAAGVSPLRNPHFTMKMIQEANTLIKQVNKFNQARYLENFTSDLVQFLGEAEPNTSHETDGTWRRRTELIGQQFSDLLPIEGCTDRYPEYLKRLWLKIQELLLSLGAEIKDFGAGKLYTVMDIHSQLHNLVIPTCSDQARYVLYILNYREILRVLEESSKKGNEPTPLVPYRLEAVDIYNHEKWQECDSLDGIWAHWTDKWTKGTPYSDLGAWQYILPSDDLKAKYIAFGWRSWEKMSTDEKRRLRNSEKATSLLWHDLSQKLEEFIERHADQLKNVDQVICFALGPINHQKPTSFVQHLATRTIRDALQQLKDSDDALPPIQILAQDPAYCERCRVVLKEELNINTTTNLDGFVKLTKNTFVVSIAASAPVLQIVADLLKDVGGPAAILCDTIDDDYTRAQRDPKLPNFADEPTRNLVEYKQNCDEEEFGDAKILLGMNWDEFARVYKDPPARIRKGLESRDTAWTRADTKRLEKCTEMHKLAGRVNFRDLTLYIRK